MCEITATQHYRKPSSHELPKQSPPNPPSRAGGTHAGLGASLSTGRALTLCSRPHPREAAAAGGPAPSLPTGGLQLLRAPGKLLSSETSPRPAATSRFSLFGSLHSHDTFRTAMSCNLLLPPQQVASGHLPLTMTSDRTFLDALCFPESLCGHET